MMRSAWKEKVDKGSYHYEHEYCHPDAVPDYRSSLFIVRVIQNSVSSPAQLKA
jgi:hypothetical protein